MIIGIGLIATYLVVQNFGYAALQVWLLRRRQPYPRWAAVALFSWATVMSFLFVLHLFSLGGWKSFLREWFYFPMAVEMVWNVLLLQVLFPAIILVVLIVRLRSRRPVAPLAPDGMSRRKFLYLLSYGAAPAAAMGMGVHGLRTREDLQVREYTIAITGLPAGLEGFTIAHVSDLHSGLFVGPARLKIISDATNDLKADLVVITGDLINRDMDEFPAALAAIRHIESSRPIYICEGNHDVIPGSCVLVAACERSGLAMLYNKCQALSFPGGRLLLGGLSWDRCFEMAMRPRMIADLFPARQEGDARILLAHHPDVFDVAQEADLVLSGHTHGGQIMFGDVGLGRIRFKYWSGLYQHPGAGTKMIVSNGCGDWFPCRIGAPAEIGLVRLTRAAA